MRSLLLSAGVAALLVSGSSFAQDANWYAGVNAGQAKHERYSNNEAFGPEDLKDRQYGAALGYRVSKVFAVELGYSDFGRSNISVSVPITVVDGTGIGTVVPGTSEVSAYHLSAVLSAPVLDMFDVYGRLGIAQATRDLRGTANFSDSILSVYQKERKTDAIVGVEFAYNFTKNIEATVEAQQLVDMKMKAVNAGLRFSF